MKKRLNNGRQAVTTGLSKLWARIDQGLLFPFYRKLIRVLDLRCEQKIRKYGLSSDWKERSLQEFKLWLADMPAEPFEAANSQSPACDLYTLLAEFAGLRNEIRLQNREQAKAVNALSGFMNACDETFELLRRSSSDLQNLEKNIAGSAERKCLNPFFDVRDTVKRGRDSAVNRRNGKRLFSRGKADLDTVIEGYDIILRRFDRAMAFSGITVVDTLGLPFDPKRMKAVTVVPGPKAESGRVVEEIRAGFVRGDEVLAFAEVVVTQ